MNSDLLSDVEKMVESWLETGFSEKEIRECFRFMGVSDGAITFALNNKNKKQS